MKPSKRQVSFISLFLFQIKLIELAILTKQRFFKRNALSIFLFGFVNPSIRINYNSKRFLFFINLTWSSLSKVKALKKVAGFCHY